MCLVGFVHVYHCMSVVFQVFRGGFSREMDEVREARETKKRIEVKRIGERKGDKRKRDLALKELFSHTLKVHLDYVIKSKARKGISRSTTIGSMVLTNHKVQTGPYFVRILCRLGATLCFRIERRERKKFGHIFCSVIWHKWRLFVFLALSGYHSIITVDYYVDNCFISNTPYFKLYSIDSFFHSIQIRQFQSHLPKLLWVFLLFFPHRRHFRGWFRLRKSIFRFIYHIA